MRQNQRKSILCPNCNKLISADEAACPHCGVSRPGSWWKSLLLMRDLFKGDRIIRTIIYANVGIYLISLLMNPTRMGFSTNPFTFLSPSNRALILLGSTGTIPIDQLHRWWTLVSANYLHASMLHIFLNMFAFWQLAPLIMREYGVNRLIIIYTFGGIIGFLVSYLRGIELTVGASAAVCSLIGAALYFGKSRGGTYGNFVFRQIFTWVVVLFIFGFLSRGIVNNWGHGGGIVGGIIIGYLLGYQERKKENLIDKSLGAMCVVLTAAVLIWAVSSSFFYRFFA